MAEKLSRREKWMYGAGDIGFSLTSTIIGAYFAIFLVDVVGLQPRIAAAAIFIGRTWDYINDPLIGNVSDRTRTRWGRSFKMQRLARLAKRVRKRKNITIRSANFNDLEGEIDRVLILQN